MVDQLTAFHFKGAGYVVGEEPPGSQALQQQWIARAHTVLGPLCDGVQAEVGFPGGGCPLPHSAFFREVHPFLTFGKTAKQAGLQNDKLRPDCIEQFCFAFSAAHSNERFIQRDGQW